MQSQASEQTARYEGNIWDSCAPAPAQQEQWEPKRAVMDPSVKQAAASGGEAAVSEMDQVADLPAHPTQPPPAGADPLAQLQHYKVQLQQQLHQHIAWQRIVADNEDVAQVDPLLTSAWTILRTSETILQLAKALVPIYGPNSAPISQAVQVAEQGLLLCSGQLVQAATIMERLDPGSDNNDGSVEDVGADEDSQHQQQMLRLQQVLDTALCQGEEEELQDTCSSSRSAAALDRLHHPQ